MRFIFPWKAEILIKDTTSDISRLAELCNVESLIPIYEARYKGKEDALPGMSDEQTTDRNSDLEAEGS
jgi:hypothetical protein